MVPLSILIFVTLRLKSELKSTSQYMATNQNQLQRNRRDRKITISLLIILIVFIICQLFTCLPYIEYVILWVVLDKLIMWLHEMIFMSFVTRHVLLVFNSSVNILIYVYFSQHYRGLVSKHVLIHFRCKRNQSSA